MLCACACYGGFRAFNMRVRRKRERKRERGGGGRWRETENQNTHTNKRAEAKKKHTHTNLFPIVQHRSQRGTLVVAATIGNGSRRELAADVL